MDLTGFEQRKVSAEKAVVLLQKQGLEISLEDAALVTDFLYMLAKLFYTQHIEE